MATFSRCLTAAALILVAASAHAQPPAPRELYRFVMIQAAPGKLPDLLALYRQRIPVITAGGDEAPILIRHSQGDRWDLLVIFPSGSFTDYYSRERVARRETAAKNSGLDGAAYLKQMYDLIAWHEDVYVQGPPVAELRAYLKDTSLAHLEMMQALAGKRDELRQGTRDGERLQHAARPPGHPHLHARAGRRVGRHHPGRVARLAAVRRVADDSGGRVGRGGEEGGLRQRRRGGRLHAQPDLDPPRHAGADRRSRKPYARSPSACTSRLELRDRRPALSRYIRASPARSSSSNVRPSFGKRAQPALIDSATRTPGRGSNG